MNALFQSLYSAVIVNTNRPNLQAETKAAIIAATRELHNRGRFKADVRESILTSTNGGQTEYKFTIPVEKAVREILNVAPLDRLGRKGVSLQLADTFSSPKCGNWFKWTNNVLTINVAHVANTFALTFLTFPTLTPDNFESWIAERYPHYITDMATFRVLLLTGQAQQAGVYKTLVGEARIPGTHIFNLLREAEEVE